MSTFDGLVAEFLEIRSESFPSLARSRCPRHVASVPNRAIVDFLRQHADMSPLLACFLSHIHSDHLAGLESLRSLFWYTGFASWIPPHANRPPSVYCSAVIREMLLRLERYPYRINYAKGILKARQQMYKHLHKVLAKKPLLLGTPTRIGLRPDHSIQATLFGANHCPGADMICAASATGFSYNPSIIEYTSGIRTLDKIYLGTSFVEDVPFQTKSEGLAELIRKVKEYPPDTVFHLQAWSYSYEDIWVALAKALNSAIHVDDYKLRVYVRCRPAQNQHGPDWHLTPEAPVLMGFMRSNEAHRATQVEGPTTILPRIIQFPYSRHSSYAELCLLVDLLEPRDVWPCTVNIKEWLQNGTPGRLPLETDHLLTNICIYLSSRTLFGPYCFGDSFAHNLRLNALTGVLLQEDAPSQARETQLTCSDLEADPSSSPPPPSAAARRARVTTRCSRRQRPIPGRPIVKSETCRQVQRLRATPRSGGCVEADGELPKQNIDEFRHGHDPEGADREDFSQQTQSLITSTPMRYSAARVDVYDQMLRK
ncbi:hypothetical protein S40285_09343 [Stachybotrys chlorohalonatus IBT 40285]|uniref:Protein artemis n=1 Tax=Stachybotrys chlorohalonatus (strain IBT 40285) TaxID=1283841 RepID=A0A084QKV6_STAC4|nr:hypothetical protein S40285_09343 [Stachybotrys chlorohalonata IBT 40285]